MNSSRMVRASAVLDRQLGGEGGGVGLRCGAQGVHDVAGLTAGHFDELGPIM